MHRDSGQSRAEAIRSAIREIRVPLVGSTITPIVVFLPLISITGVTGVFFRALAVTVGMALLTSLALALTWTPTLSHYFLRNRRAPAPGGASRCSALADAHLRARRCAFTLEHPLVLASVRVAADRRSLFLLQPHRHRPAAGDGRGRLHRRLHHAGRLFARGDQPRHQPRGEDPARHAGSGEHLAPHRPAARPGRGDRSQHRRHFGEAEARPQAQRRRGDRRRARQNQESRAGARHRIPAASAGHDRRSHQRARAGGHQAVLAGSRAAAPVGRRGGRHHQEDSRRGGRAGRHRKHHQRPGHAFSAWTRWSPRAPASRRRKWNWMPAPCCRASRRTTPVVVNDRSYTIRVRFPESTRATLDSIRNTLLVSGTGKTATIGSLANDDRRSRARPKSAARICSATCR